MKEYEKDALLFTRSDSFDEDQLHRCYYHGLGGHEARIIFDGGWDDLV